MSLSILWTSIIRYLSSNLSLFKTPPMYITYWEDMKWNVYKLIGKSHYIKSVYGPCQGLAHKENYKVM